MVMIWHQISSNTFFISIGRKYEIYYLFYCTIKFINWQLKDKSKKFDEFSKKDLIFMQYSYIISIVPFGELSELVEGARLEIV